MKSGIKRKQRIFYTTVFFIDGKNKNAWKKHSQNVTCMISKYSKVTFLSESSILFDVGLSLSSDA
jgi:hypothetical protein